MLGFLALLSQTLLLLLPMPAMARDAEPVAGFVLCHAGGEAPAEKSDKTAGHHGVPCPVCQVFQIMGSLVAPPPPALDFPAAAACGLAAGIEAAALPARPPSDNQARAPPPSI